MKIVAWMVVKNDAYYIDMALESVINNVDGIYIQDQCSDDGTTEKIISFVNKYPDKIVLEFEDTGLPRFDPNYNEPYYRSLAIKRAEETLSPEWLLKLDADEIYTEYFFSKLKELENKFQSGQWNCARVSGERFVAVGYRTASDHALQYDAAGNRYYDPHNHLWRADLKVRYVKNPRVDGFFHCILDPDPAPIKWISGICNIHLHKTFGPKSYNFWAEGGDKFERITPFNARTMAPKWFNSTVNIGMAEKVDYKFPDYVMKKWKEFGTW